MLDVVSGVLLRRLVELLDIKEWAHLLCVSRTVKIRVLEVLEDQVHDLTFDLGPQHRHRSLQMLLWTGHHCPHLRSVFLQPGSGHSSRFLQHLQPCLTPELQHMTLRNFDLSSHLPLDASTRRGSNPTSVAAHLVHQLLQSCPHLQTLDLQFCTLPSLHVLSPLVAYTESIGSNTPQRQQIPQHLQPGSVSHERIPHDRLHPWQQQQTLRVLELTGVIVARQACKPQGRQPTQRAVTTQVHECKETDSTPVRRLQEPSSDQSITSGLQKLHLGCAKDGGTCFRDNETITDEAVVQLLQVAGTQALQVLSVSKRSCITDGLLTHLAVHAPQLRMLNISLTSVTPSGVVAVLQGCRHLRTLRYACRTGCASLVVSNVQAIASAGQQLQELDISLHAQLDDECMRWLACCQRLQKLTLCRSHKVTATGIEALLQAGTLQLLVLIRSKGVNKQQLQLLSRKFPACQVQPDK